MIKDKTPDDKDLLIWRWLAGSLTTKAEFGSPTSTTDYQLCVYNSAGMILDAAAPAGGICNVARPKPCWTDKTTGFKYNDRDLTPDGIQSILLKEGLEVGKARIILRAKGLLLDDVAIPISQPVTVQLLNSDGECWEAVYNAPATTNTAGPPPFFKDKAD